MRVYKEAIAAFSVGPIMYIQGMLVRKYAAELPEAIGPRTGIIGPEFHNGRLGRPRRCFSPRSARHRRPNGRP